MGESRPPTTDARTMLRRRTAALAAAIASLALAAPASALADCGGSELVPDAANLAAAGQATLCLVNAERAARGLGALAEEARLTEASSAFSRRMVADRFFAHVAPDGATLVERLTAVRYIADGVDWSVGENIGWGQGDLATPRSIVTAWMNSPGHRANILSPDYTQIGLGLATGSPADAAWGATYTTDFGALDGAAGEIVTRGTSSAAPSARAKAATAAARQRAQSTRARRARCTHARGAAERSAAGRRKGRSRACRPPGTSAKKR